MLNDFVTAEENRGSVSLVIDYSNGLTKSYAAIPYRPRQGQTKLGVTDVLDLANLFEPGLAYEFASRGSDRVAHEVGTIAAVDGVGAEGSGQQWAVWVNQQPVAELRRVVASTMEHMRVGVPSVSPGDRILLKLVSEGGE